MQLHLLQTDITTLTVDIIVNAANSSLLGGGGVDGAIHRAGGPDILAECRQIRARQGGCKTGEAVITTAGRLPAQQVIHTVGPVWTGGNKDEDELLRNCYLNALALAEQQDARSIAFPNISTGVYGFPKQRAAEVAVRAVRDFTAQSITDVYFVCFDTENYRIYETLI
ncbi:O-acetyl-ADP-ribose deacetylase [Neolewinella sp.]|uniref:O-acetyl-ADP-ribose deacetylase n=1 Tax=Neolewinella sp. TaxID=2993543 RepID=UPI003B526063